MRSRVYRKRYERLIPLAMYISKLCAEGFRNLKDVNVSPCKSINIIAGRNAQGKTNLLEAIWLMSGCRSFRGSKDSEFLCFGQQKYSISVSFCDLRRSQSLSRSFSRDGLKEVRLNGVVQKNYSGLFNAFRCVVFTPDDYALINSSPEVRRSFIDLSHCQISPSNIHTVRNFQLASANRNALLKNSAHLRDIGVWDWQIANLGARLAVMRSNYISKLAKSASALYSSISGSNEVLSCTYRSNVYPADFDYPKEVSREMIDIYLQKLSDSLSDDIRRGFTLCGCLRDDLTLKLNGRNLRDFGSQGQKKSAALSLKLAQADILSSSSLDSPIVLLDDVMGELDTHRQKLVLETTGNMQVFLSVCNLNVLPEISDCRIFSVKDGRVSE